MKIYILNGRQEIVNKQLYFLMWHFPDKSIKNGDKTSKKISIKIDN